MRCAMWLLLLFVYVNESVRLTMGMCTKGDLCRKRCATVGYYEIHENRIYAHVIRKLVTKEALIIYYIRMTMLLRLKINGTVY